MDWKVITAIVLFVFGLMGFSMYQSTNAHNEVTGQVVTSDCLDDSCSEVDLSVLDLELEDELEEEEEAEEPEQPKGEVKEITSLKDVDEIVVNEGDLIKLTLDAVDPDGDRLYYSFSEPFDEEGAWQTQNGDADAYDVTVTVTDGEFVVSQDLSLLVLPVNWAPEFTSVDPDVTTITLAERDTLEASVEAYDDDGDDITYTWLFDGETISDEPTVEYELSYEDAGRKRLQIVLFDGTVETDRAFTVVVEDKNRAPSLSVPEQVNATETGVVAIEASASDADGDDVSILFSAPFTDDGEWETDYESSGVFQTTVTATDGDLSTTEEVEVVVVNKNRAPEYTGLSSITVNEGEQVVLDFSVTDPDGEDVTTVFASPLDDEGVWETDFDDAGEYVSIVTFTDGKDIVDVEVPIEVLNVNRAPELYPLDDIEVTETDLVEVSVLAADPDDEDVTVTFSGPLDADGTWQTDYDSAGEYEVVVTATDGDLEVTSSFTLTVENKNRPPQILGVSN